MSQLAQRLFMSSGGKKDSTYVDDVFSTYVYTGNQTAGHTITNGIDLAGEGGLVWIKGRESAYQHELVDTVRGAGYLLKSDGTSGQGSSTSSELDQFNSDGFRLAYRSAGGNTNDQDYASWSFRKQKGFFDVVSYSGTNTASRDIAHSLGCIPGVIIIKRLDASGGWWTYHRDLDDTSNSAWSKVLRLDRTDAQQDAYCLGADDTHTSSTFRIGNDNSMNTSGGSYIAYLWAGGASTAATARSVDFDGSGDYLTQTCDAVLRNWWDQAFTVEYWVNADGFVSSGNGGPGVLGVCAPTSNGETWSFGPKSNGTVEFYYWNGSIQQVTTTKALNLGQWYHLAMVYDGSSSIKIYINGILEKSANKSGSPAGASTVFSIGKIANGSEFNGRVSNVRITHQALYTSSFKPSTEPFTTTSQGATGSNVKLLCCNNSSVTGSTVTPASITANGNPTASTNIPFDDPKGFKFGEEGDQNIIKTGSYIGRGGGGSGGPIEVDLGFEPSWVMVKNASASSEWVMFDSMRGVATDLVDERLVANGNAAEANYGANFLEFTSTGFKVIIEGNSEMNQSGSTHIYMAIRRPDPLVAKPAEVGTDVFALARGAGNPSFPCFVTGFPVDFLLQREFATADAWITGARLTGTEYMYTNATNAAAGTNYNWGSNTGAVLDRASSYQGWLWKRSAGFDVVATRAGTGNNMVIRHSLGRNPEMIWAKKRNTSNFGDSLLDNWWVWHKDVSTADRCIGFLNNTDAETGYNMLKTSVTNSVSASFYSNITYTGDKNLILFFASVDGISKVGSYNGTGSAGHVITTGFVPRFLIIKTTNAANGWFTYDSVRGLGSGADPYLQLQNSNAQDTSGADVFATSSTGFTINQTYSSVNASGQKYIYYAHA